MSSGLKRKGSPSLEEDAESSKRHLPETEGAKTMEPSAEEPVEPVAPLADEEEEQEKNDAPTQSERTADESNPTSAPLDRAARFAALRARNQSSRKENLKETRNEARRAATDPSQLASLTRKRDIAEHKLLKADVEAAGEDFERKRAWDWTVEESERWDERVAEKARKKDGVAFRDYGHLAGRVYERQVGEMERKGAGMEERRERYEREKAEAIERSVRRGGLEIVETEAGELIAVDRDGGFYSSEEGVAGVGGKPDKAAVDRLVEDIKKAEEVRMRKRRERGRADDDGGDVTYINEKNKQFNMKLARFYDKYTGEIRESFERGTAI